MQKLHCDKQRAKPLCNVCVIMQLSWIMYGAVSNINLCKVLTFLWTKWVSFLLENAFYDRFFIIPHLSQEFGDHLDQDSSIKFAEVPHD